MPLHIEDNNYLRLAAIRYLEYYHDKAILKNPQLLTYDASQSTLWDSNFLVDNEDYCAMPIAVSHILPSAKFIVVMRNPVTRTYSHYLYTCAYEKKRLPSSNVFHMRVLANVNYFKDCLARNFTIYECAKDNHFDIHEKQGCGSVDYLPAPPPLRIPFTLLQD